LHKEWTKKLATEDYGWARPLVDGIVIGNQDAGGAVECYYVNKPSISKFNSNIFLTEGNNLKTFFYQQQGNGKILNIDVSGIECAHIDEAVCMLPSGHVIIPDIRLTYDIIKKVVDDGNGDKPWPGRGGFDNYKSLLDYFNTFNWNGENMITHLTKKVDEILVSLNIKEEMVIRLPMTLWEPDPGPGPLHHSIYLDINPINSQVVKTDTGSYMFIPKLEVIELRDEIKNKLKNLIKIHWVNCTDPFFTENGGVHCSTIVRRKRQ